MGVSSVVSWYARQLLQAGHSTLGSSGTVPTSLFLFVVLLLLLMQHLTRCSLVAPCFVLWKQAVSASRVCLDRCIVQPPAGGNRHHSMCIWAAGSASGVVVMVDVAASVSVRQAGRQALCVNSVAALDPGCTACCGGGGSVQCLFVQCVFLARTAAVSSPLFCSWAGISLGLWEGVVLLAPSRVVFVAAA